MVELQGAGEQQLAAAEALVRQAQEVGKAAVSTHSWLQGGSQAELTVVRMNHRIGDKVTQAMIESEVSRAKKGGGVSALR